MVSQGFLAGLGGGWRSGSGAGPCRHGSGCGAGALVGPQHWAGFIGTLLAPLGDYWCLGDVCMVGRGERVSHLKVSFLGGVSWAPWALHVVSGATLLKYIFILFINFFSFSPLITTSLFNKLYPHNYMPNTQIRLFCNNLPYLLF